MADGLNNRPFKMMRSWQYWQEHEEDPLEELLVPCCPMSVSEAERLNEENRGLACYAQLWQDYQSSEAWSPRLKRNVPTPAKRVGGVRWAKLRENN